MAKASDDGCDDGTEQTEGITLGARAGGSDPKDGRRREGGLLEIYPTNGLRTVAYTLTVGTTTVGQLIMVGPPAQSRSPHGSWGDKGYTLNSMYFLWESGHTPFSTPFASTHVAGWDMDKVAHPGELPDLTGHARYEMVEKWTPNTADVTPGLRIKLVSTGSTLGYLTVNASTLALTFYGEVDEGALAPSEDAALTFEAYTGGAFKPSYVCVETPEAVTDRG